MQVYGLLFTRTSKYFFQLGQKKKAMTMMTCTSGVHVHQVNYLCETPASPSYIHLNLDQKKCCYGLSNWVFTMVCETRASPSSLVSLWFIIYANK